MAKKKIHRDIRSLGQEKMFIFLKLLAHIKKRSSLQDCIKKIQIKYPEYRPTRIEYTLRHLQKDGYVRFERNIYPQLIEKGYTYLESVAQKERTHWDRRFRIVLFDSIDTHQNNREYIRAKIKSYGFKQLVRGAWIYPYPCDAFIKLLQLEYQLKNIPLCFTTQDTDSMSSIRKHFRLR